MRDPKTVRDLIPSPILTLVSYQSNSSIHTLSWPSICKWGKLTLLSMPTDLWMEMCLSPIIAVYNLSCGNSIRNPYMVVKIWSKERELPSCTQSELSQKSHFYICWNTCAAQQYFVPYPLPRFVQSRYGNVFFLLDCVMGYAWSCNSNSKFCKYKSCMITQRYLYSWSTFKCTFLKHMWHLHVLENLL